MKRLLWQFFESEWLQLVVMVILFVLFFGMMGFVVLWMIHMLAG